jgi:uncharacterized membrane protein YdjX (TVP38/TMEM64 family)
MRRRVILATLAFAAAAVLLALSPWRTALESLAAWARAAGPTGLAAFAAAYALGSVLALPVWPITVAAGVAYGAAGGFALALPAGTLGASLAFLVGRSLLREVVARRVAGDPRLAALDAEVSRRGILLVFLVRLTPLAPYNVVNYAVSASRIGLVPFAAASLAGMAPITFAWAWVGATLGVLEGVSGGPPPGPAQRAVQWIGLAATVALVVVLGWTARRALGSAPRR